MSIKIRELAKTPKLKKGRRLAIFTPAARQNVTHRVSHTETETNCDRQLTGNGMSHQCDSDGY